MENVNSEASKSEQETGKSSGKQDLIVVGIGASAGGVTALREFFAKMPSDSGLAFVVILHLSQTHESNLAAILQTQTTMPVVQIGETLKVEPNSVYVIPPAKHLEMVDGVVYLREPERIKGRRVPIDIFFRTLSEHYGKNAVAIVLSGTGSDGTLGLKRVKEVGGLTIVQDPKDSEYDGMPQSAIKTGLVDLILPIAAMPEKLVAFKNSSLNLLKPILEEAKIPQNFGVDALQEVLLYLRSQTAHDFTNYKQATLLRRIARRLQVHEIENLHDYLKILREQPEEVQALLRDFLISVTNFFRDSEAFQALEKDVIPSLFIGKTAASQIRVWTVGCATGEEAYSIAILLQEYADRIAEPPRIQIFASDIDDAAILTARESRYEDTIAADVSPERLRRFFTKDGSGYKLKKEIRDMILFTPHNILRDPPFSQIDLVTCRNLLIYLNRETQEQVLEIFNYSLRPEGFLFLGASESGENMPAVYSTVDKKQRIYRSKNRLARNVPLPSMPNGNRNWQMKTPQTVQTTPIQNMGFGELHFKLVEEYAPPSIVINEEQDIVHLSENAGRYLRFVGGEPSRNLLRVINPALRLDLRATLFTAKQENKQVEAKNVQFDIEGDVKSVDIVVRPANIPEISSGYFLVIIKENVAPAKVDKKIINGLKASEDVVKLFEDELQTTKDRLRATIEQHETSIEELKASNEELQAINEELRSTTEELETSKEESQSVNEELVTVNNELKDKVDEVSNANSDLQNLMASTDIGTIFLDRNLLIKRYTPVIAQIFNVIPSDIGRPFEHLTNKLDYPELMNDANEVLTTLQNIEREIHQPSNDSWHLARISPYMTLGNQSDGIVLTFVNITERRRAQNANTESNENFKVLANSMSQLAWMTDASGYIFWYNQRWFEYTGTTLEQMQGWGWQAVQHPSEVERVLTKFKRHLESGEKWEDTFPIRSKSGEYRWFLSRATPIRNDEGKIIKWFGTNTDIEDVRQAEEQLKQADKRKDEFLAILSHELRNPLAPIRTALTILQNDPKSEQTEKTHAVIERQVAQLEHLVDDLLDISRISNGKIKLKLEQLNITDAINAATEASKPYIDGNRHTLKTNLSETPIFVEADMTRLTQIILNIVNNAAKYTEPNGEISIESTTENNEAVVRIKDNGLGIAPEKLKSIFEIFAQIEHGENRSQSGLGIGLSVVKQLVEMHKGTVEAKSEGEKQGSEFIIKFPLSTQQKPAKKPEKMPKQNKESNGKSEKKRILIVDDNVDAAEMLEMALSLEGHETQTAFDGSSALAKAKEFSPEVVLLDIGLPDIDGYETARRIRAQFNDVTLIALSGWGQDEDRRKSKEAGFNHHLVKPVQLEQITDIIAKV